jgi:serine/threonine protein kinase
VLKDTYYPQVIWDDVDTDFTLEHLVQQELNRCEGSQNVVKCLAYCIYAEDRMVRLYFEDCGYGDLESLIKRHAYVRDHIRDAMGSPVEYRIPTPMLWCIFEALVSAVCLMHPGTLPIHQQGSKVWTPILHRDIKPDNIFLGAAHEKIWPGMPMLKLGDFGLAVEIDRRKPPGTSGTQSYTAHERRKPNHPMFLEALRTPATATSSDIWSVGRVMHSLMNLHRQNTFDLVEQKGMPVYTAGVKAFYRANAPDLLEMVEECLIIEPMQRPEAAVLWKDIQVKVGLHRDFSMTLPPLKTVALSLDEKVWFKQAETDVWLPAPPPPPPL